MTYRTYFSLTTTLAFALTAMAAAQAPTAQNGARRGARGPQPPPLEMTVSGFADGGTIPTQFTCSASPGPALSPAVSWTHTPAGTKSFVLLVHDPEPHPGKKLEDITHWLIWNIPGTATSLPQGVPAGATLPDGAHQLNFRNQPEYMGPCASPGPQHHYTWQLLALDTTLDLPANASRAQVMQATDGHILGAAEWIGRFARSATPAK
jgi:Raf kinase inhibitor-like YbhB/YbcL family protein